MLNLKAVATTPDGDNYLVSTVKVPFAYGHPYETLVFVLPQQLDATRSVDRQVLSWLEVYGERYASADEAEAGHRRIFDGIVDGSIIIDW